MAAQGTTGVMEGQEWRWNFHAPKALQLLLLGMVEFKSSSMSRCQARRDETRRMATAGREGGIRGEGDVDHGAKVHAALTYYPLSITQSCVEYGITHCSDRLPHAAVPDSVS